MAQNRRARQAHVADGAVAAQGHRLAPHVRGDLAHVLHDDRRLAVGDERDLERRVIVDHALHALGDAVRQPLGAYEQHDDAGKVANLLERGQAAVQLGTGRGQVRRVVVSSRRFELDGVARPVTRNDDGRIHAAPSLTITAGRLQAALRASGDGPFRFCYLVVPN